MKDKSKAKSVKASKSNRTRETRQLRKDAASIFDIITSDKIPQDIRYEVGCLVTEEIDPANIVERHKELFVQCYVAAAREPNADISELERILDGLDAGEQLADVVVMTETIMRRQAQENRGPNFVSLARNISGVLNDPNTPAEFYNELADKVADLSDPYLESVRKTPDFIEKCLIFAARGEVKAEPEAKTADQQRADLARLIYSVFNHPALPDILKREFQTAYVNFENAEVDIEVISQTLPAIKHALDLASKEEKGGAE